VFDAGDGLGGAGEVVAEVGADDPGVAFWALFGGAFFDGALAGGALVVECVEEVVGFCVGWAEGLIDFDDGGDDFAGLFDEDGVAEVDVFVGDFRLVVEGGAGDGGAADKDGFEFGDGGELSGASDLDGDGAEDGFFLFGEEFEGAGPAGEFGGGAELVVKGDLVDFDNGAIGGVGKVVAVVVELGDGGVEFCGGVDGFEPFGFLESVFFEGGLELFDGVVGRVGDFAIGVEDAVEGAGGGELGVELLEGAGGGVAGVDEELFAGGFTLFVEFEEVGIGHEDFATDFEEVGGGVWEGEGDGADGADILGDIVAYGAVATSEGVGKLAVAVDEGDGDSVDFGFDTEGEGVFFFVEGAGEAVEPVVDVFGGWSVGLFLLKFVKFFGFEFVNVLDGEHGAEVILLLEAVERFSADALGGRVRVVEVGVFFFEFFEFA